MKISKLESVVLLLTAIFLAFSAGWFLRGRAVPQPIVVEAQRTLTAPHSTPAVLPAPTPVVQKILDLNTATAAELEALPGIGEKRAADIVAYRTRNGPFRIVEDITNIPGIGESTLKELLPYLKIDDGGTQ